MDRYTDKITDKNTKVTLCYRVKCRKDLEAVQKLGKLEDLEEENRLPKLACSVGTDVYFVSKDEESPVLMTVDFVKICKDGTEYHAVKTNGLDGEITFKSEDIGKDVFFSEEDAKEALFKMKQHTTVDLFGTNGDLEPYLDGCMEWRDTLVPVGAMVTSYVLVLIADGTAAIAKYSADVHKSGITLGEVADAELDFVKKLYEADGHEVKEAVFTSKESYDNYVKKYNPDSCTLSYKKNEKGGTDFFRDGEPIGCEYDFENR